MYVICDEIALEGKNTEGYEAFSVLNSLNRRLYFSDYSCISSIFMSVTFSLILLESKDET